MSSQENGFQEKDFTFIGTRTLIEGILKLSGKTHINGHISGELHIEDKSLLTFETYSSFKGDVFCHDLEVYGNLDGSIQATGKVIIYPPAKVSGKIKSENLVIYPGAQVEIKADAEDYSQRKSW